MNSSKKIGFAGVKTNDIIMYLSRILVNLGRNIALVDASKEQHLKYSVPEAYKGDIITYRNVDVFLNCTNSQNYENVDMKAYDIIFINFGFNYELIEEYIKCNILFTVSDLESHNISMIKEFLARVDKTIEIIRIFRDVVDCKINKKYINSIFDSLYIKNVKDYDLELDDMELICRLESQHNDIFKFQKLPRDYKDMLKDIVTKNIEIDGKLYLGALKTAERGR